MEKYLIRGEDSVSLVDPPPSEVNTELDKINKKLREGKAQKPSRNYFIVLLFAGLGVQKEGGQALVYNDFDKDGAIKLFKAEAKVRSWGSIYPNAYLLCIFACDRTIYDEQNPNLPRFKPYINDVSSIENRL